MAIGAAIGAVVSMASYAIVAHATGQEITAGGLAGAAVGGAIAGAVSVIAAPLAGTVMAAAGLEVTASSAAIGAAIVNGAGGATAYLAGGEATNAVDAIQGKDPEFHPTVGGAVSSAVFAGTLSYGIGKALQSHQVNTPLHRQNIFYPAVQQLRCLQPKMPLNNMGRWL
jgi:hypothetical protein